MTSPGVRRSLWTMALIVLLAASCGSDDSAPPGSLSALGAIDWATGNPPTTPLGEIGPAELPADWPEEPRAALAATFGSAAEAESAAAGLEAALRASVDERGGDLAWDVVPELTPSERSWLMAAGTTPTDRGIGWMGPAAAVVPPVQILGSAVVVSDLIFVSQWDEQGNDRTPNPLQTAFEAMGAEVIGEQDWIDDIGIGFDLQCTTATDEQAAALAGEVADHLALPHRAMPLPPWAGELTEEQQAIRHSYRIELRRRQATSERATSSRAFMQAAQRLADAMANGDRDDIAARQADLAEVFERDQPTEVSDDAHPIVASWVALDAGFGPPEDDVWLNRGIAVGQADYRRTDSGATVLSGVAAATRAYMGSVGVDGNQVQLGSFHGPAMSTLLPALAGHLASGGCTDLTYTLVDADLLWNL